MSQASTTEPGRNVRRWALVALAVVAVTAAALALLQPKPPAEVAAPAEAPPRDVVTLADQSRRDAGLTVEAARLMQRTTQIEAPGVLALDETRTARPGSIVEGTVVRLHAEVGDRVESGSLLAELHGPVVHETWAAYRKAVAEKRRAQIELDYAVQAHERAQRLHADKAISLQELQRARADREAAEQSFEVTKTELRRAEETLEHYGITSGEDPSGEAGESVAVRSPMAGAVLERDVTAGAAVTSGSQMFVVSDLSSLWAVAEVEETQLSRLRVGAPVGVRVAAYPETTFSGSIIFIGDTLDPTTRRVRVRCHVPNPDGRLKPQMFATLAVGEGAPVNVTAVPTAAVQEMDGAEVVFIAVGDGSFKRRDVVVGREADGWTEILRGIEPGEQVAAAGSFLLKSELLRASAPAED